MIELGMRRIKFTTTGIFTVPKNITKIMVRGSAGGGGGINFSGSFGSYSFTDGTNGGNTSFGSLVVLTGGTGATHSGQTSIAGVDGGFGANGLVNLFGSRTYTTSVNTNLSIGGIGGGGTNAGATQIGGTGECTVDEVVTVTPGQSYTVTVGAGGVTASGLMLNNINGGDGFLIVEW